jgi:hypothetical protein
MALEKIRFVIGFVNLLAFTNGHETAGNQRVMKQWKEKNNMNDYKNYIFS